MPRYFFDVFGSPQFRDEEGEYFDTLDSAKGYALQVAHAIINKSANGKLKDVEVAVRDEGGEVFRLTISAD
jgi:Domain of unknown function (DUF6894)